MDATNLSRRQFLGASAATALSASLENLVHAQPIPKVDLSLMLAALNALNAKQDKREKAPTNGALKDAEKEVIGVFEKDYKARKPEFAETLLKGAGEQKGATRYVMLRDAADISSENFKLSTTFKAIEKLAENYDAKLEPIVSGALKASKSKAKKPDQNAEFTQFGIDVTELSLKWNDFDAAYKAITEAKSTAGKSGDKSLVERANELDKEVSVIKKEFDDYRKAEAELSKIQPADTVGNPKLQADFEKYSLVVGKWSCFQENKWDIGMYMLRIGADKDLQEIAKKEIALKEEKVKPTAENFYDLAESWYTKFQGTREPRDKNRYLGRAWNWYDKSRESATGLFKTKVEKRMGEIEKLGGRKGSIDLLKMIDPMKDVVAGEWILEGQSLICKNMVPRARIMLPYIPPQEYDLTLVVERKEGVDALIVGLASGQRQFVHELDGYSSDGHISGFEYLDGKSPNVNTSGTTKGPIFTNNKVSTVVYSIRKGRIAITVDGIQKLNWQGDFNQLSVREDYNVPSKEALFLGAFSSKYSVSKANLTPFVSSDVGKKLR